jgi:very-short-patch-repair endonuclease
MLLRRHAALYANPTPAELAIEPAVASLGTPYRFNHALWALGVFPDFVLLRQRLVIEVDGKEHRTPSGRRKDEARTKKLNAAGWSVVRC